MAHAAAGRARQSSPGRWNVGQREQRNQHHHGHDHNRNDPDGGGFTVVDGRIVEIDVLVDPERRRRLDASVIANDADDR
jgi:hypothetical protein